MVGPMWDQLRSAELSLVPSGMRKGRLTRRVGVVRFLGSSGQGGATRRHQHVPGMPDDSGGDLGQYGSAASSDAAAARRALARVQDQARGGGCRFQAELDGDAQVRVSGQHDTGMTQPRYGTR